MRKPGKFVPLFGAVLRAAVWFSVVAVISGAAKAQRGTLDPSSNAGLGLGQGINGSVHEVAFHLDGVLVNGLSSFSRLKADGSVDASFAPVINGTVSWFTVQPDGRILIAGYFTTVGGLPRNGVARLLADGRVDTEFDPGNGPGGAGDLIKLLPDGRIVVGYNYYDISYPGLAWLSSDGKPDLNVVPPPNVHGLLGVESDGKVLTTSYAVSPPQIARLTLDGALDTTFTNTYFNNIIYGTQAQPDGRLLVWGGFTSPGINLVRLLPDGEVDPSFVVERPSGGAIPTAAAQGDGRVVLGGGFHAVGADE